MNAYLTAVGRIAPGCAGYQFRRVPRWASVLDVHVAHSTTTPVTPGVGHVATLPVTWPPSPSRLTSGRITDDTWGPNTTSTWQATTLAPATMFARRRSKSAMSSARSARAGNPTRSQPGDGRAVGGGVGAVYNGGRWLR